MCLLNIYNQGAVHTKSNYDDEKVNGGVHTTTVMTTTVTSISLESLSEQFDE